jgi:RimJ/RimL family protein N-acetyltransferase
MLTTAFSQQLTAERHRVLLAEAATERLVRQADPGRGHTITALAGFVARARLVALVRIRPIRATDEDLLRDGFARLSADSRRLRFFVSKKRLTSDELQYLTNVDHHDHEALVAVRRFGGEGLGVARYIRDPKDRDAADVAVTVVDEWQGRGLGTMLAGRLATRARCAGLHRFTATVLEENDGARRLLPKVGAVRLVGRDRDVLDYEIALAPVAAERRSYRWSTLAPAIGC